MKKTPYLYLTVIFCLLCACEKEETFVSNTDWMEICTNIDSNIFPRATITPEGNGHFDVGDCINLFITPDDALNPTESHKLTL